MSSQGLLSVEKALEQIVSCAVPRLETCILPLAQCLGRYLATDLIAQHSQPPFRSSAMDGYAVRSADISSIPSQFKLIGESAAGKGFKGTIGSQEAIRIYTGAPVPDSADMVIMQEDTESADGFVTILQPQTKTNIRDAGTDFKTGQVLLSKGQKLDGRHIGLAAAAGFFELTVFQPLNIAILATGDELALPGSHRQEDQIFSSNSYAIKALIEQHGGNVIDLGIAKDNKASLEAALTHLKTQKVDILITMGGVSVGDYDLVQPVLIENGMSSEFWRVAVRPGKPLMFGKLGDTLVFGLPGNPVSAYITCLLFVVPAIKSMNHVANAGHIQTELCILGADLPANGERQDNLRAKLSFNKNGKLVATPFASQDSSLLSILSQADALIVREPFEAPLKAGSFCKIIRLSEL
ncbi:gephyrin-like molybdotransferase Glp [Microvirga sp. W0021]|uniref:Molybdopterin molybdenumtransferase n=1 Tax=Hohaiivirga grylli TaxID=3133970 RepID=A0ABV0BIK1_9HYPH